MGVVALQLCFMALALADSSELFNFAVHLIFQRKAPTV